MLPVLGEQGRNNAIRARLAALPGVGQAQVDAFQPSLRKQGFPDDHTAYATTENNALRTSSGQALVTDQQDHVTHFGVHMQDAVGHLQQLQQGNNGSAPVDPHEVLIHLEQAGPHMGQHLQRVQQDPTRKDQVKQMTSQLQDLGKATDQLGQQVTESDQAAAAAQPQQPSMDPQAVAPLLKVHGDLQLKAAKDQGQLKLKEEAQQQKQKLADLKTAADIRRANLKAGTDISRKNAETGASIRRANIETGAGIGRTNLQTRHGMAQEAAKTQQDISLQAAIAEAQIASQDQTKTTE